MFNSRFLLNLRFQQLSIVSSRFKHDNATTGILMMNMGGPENLDEVEPFLTRLFTDPDLIPLPFQNNKTYFCDRQLGPLIAHRRAPSIKAKYAEIGGGSPIKAWTHKQGRAMIEQLKKLAPDYGPFKYYIGFSYVEPLVEKAIEKMESDGIKRAIAFSQYAQYSCSTSGSSFNSIARYYHKNKGKKDMMKWSFIDRWHMNRGLVGAFVDNIKKELDQFPENIRDKVVLLFSAHALPLAAVARGDTYPAEVAATVHLVMESLNWSHSYRLVWQSKVGPSQWLSPQTDDALKGFVKNGQKNFLLIPISFVNEHIETLHELDIEYAHELGQQLKVETIRRVAAPNDHPKMIQGLAEIVKSHLDKKEPCSPQMLLRCPMCTKQICQITRDFIKSQF